ncbi:hypothetical protein GF386_04720 [Candidatus Pacearchaeota archaeon]|nr:hypothetical protein [Candidatus Pacearchaeota archaeon]MBD3283420.1 hypothetical protein [Candidatus Pacearchaeota archaeon]
MPIYEYQCTNDGCEKHGIALEYLVQKTDGVPDRCDYCHQTGTLERVQIPPRVSIRTLRKSDVGQVGGLESKKIGKFLMELPFGGIALGEIITIRKKS